MEVQVDVRGGSLPWNEDAIKRLALHALSYMKVPQECEVSVSLVSRDEIHELNRDYRGVDNYTDVLSFECDSPWEEHAEGEPIEIGDVVMCTDVIDEQRAQFNTTFEQEASLMLVHSVLHLLGYDHMEAEERAQMEQLEKEILDSYGLTGIR